MNYYSKINVLILVFALSLFGCSKDSDDENVSPAAEPDEFFVEMDIDGTHYKNEFTIYDEDKVSFPGISVGCQNKQVGSGAHSIYISEKDDFNDILYAFRIKIVQPIRLTELNSEDETDYSTQVLNSQQFGYPEDENGYSRYVNQETNEVVFEKEGVTEVYFDMETKYRYFTTYEYASPKSADPAIQPESSYFIIDKITRKEHINSDLHEWNQYEYIIEGRFACQMYLYGNLDQYNQSKSQITSGHFRIPYKQFETNNLFNFCDRF